MTGIILQKSISMRDEVGQGLIRKMIVCPREVRDSVLNEFVYKCRIRYKIAFYQWRLRFPNNLKHDEEQLKELITGMLKKFVLDDESQDQVIGPNTLKDSKLSKEFIKKYHILDGETFPFMVNTFN